MTLRSLAVLATLTGLLGCGGSGEGETKVLVPVSVATVVRDTMPEGVDVVGVLRPSPGHAALLTAPVAGTVRRTVAQVGEHVQQGTLLVDIDAPELAATAQSTALAAEVAAHDATRQQALLDQGVTSRRAVEEKQAQARSAQAEATSAAALLARASVRSPIAGDVQRIFVQPGERVDAGAPLAEVVDGRSIDLVGAVPAPELVRLHPGQLVQIEADGFPAGATGRVHAVAPALDSASHSGQVIIRLAEGAGLPSGLGATGRVRTGLLRDAIVVPDSALVIVGGTQSVFVVAADSAVHLQAVEVLAHARGRSAIRGDVAPGALVVTAGAWGLADGMRVAPTP
jgi:membrane fusion protein (multidrug efflux system)